MEYEPIFHFELYLKSDPNPHNYKGQKSDLNADPDPHQIKVRTRIRIKVMRIHNTALCYLYSHIEMRTEILNTLILYVSGLVVGNCGIQIEIALRYRLYTAGGEGKQS
jgi:hypothetical protein